VITLTMHTKAAAPKVRVGASQSPTLPAAMRDGQHDFDFNIGEIETVSSAPPYLSTIAQSHSASGAGAAAAFTD
jgi:hypothetical protein